MIVSTVMSNLGFYKALENEGIKSNKTKVGDRYVVEEMRKGNYNLGGEAIWTYCYDGLQYYRRWLINWCSISCCY